MKIRSLMLCMAAGLVATLAFVTPSQAGSTLVTTDLTYSLTGAGNPTLTDIQIQYSSVDPISDLKMVSGTFTGVVLSEPHPNLVEITFNRTGSGTIEFTFVTGAAPGSVTGFFTGHSGVITGSAPATETSVVTVTSAPIGVPEPASIALLGIGMTGFLAFRRFFKKTSVA
jgi:PEP-CTERM motif